MAELHFFLCFWLTSYYEQKLNLFLAPGQNENLIIKSAAHINTTSPSVKAYTDTNINVIIDSVIVDSLLLSYDLLGEVSII